MRYAITLDLGNQKITTTQKGKGAYDVYDAIVSAKQEMLLTNMARASEMKVIDIRKVQ